jgi:ribokinase
VRFVGAVGRDDFARSALSGLIAAGVSIDAVAMTDRPTGCAAIGVAVSGENAIIVASGANRTVRADQLDSSWPASDTTLLLQMEVPAAEVTAAARRVHGEGGRVILNLAPARTPPDGLLAACDVLLVNRIEAAMVAGEAADDSPPAALAHRLSSARGLSVILTLGCDGFVGADADGVFAMAALKIEPVDTTGAGDCFAGVLAAGLDAGLDLRIAVRRAGVAGALACLALGAQAALPSAAEIDARLLDAPRVRSVNGV